jgi:surface polysaccharide O-acyltransferase-like enzyme
MSFTATSTRPAARIARPAGQGRPARDQFVDLLRVAAIVVIVVQHWLMPVLAYDDGRLVTSNAFAGPGGWAITWVTQVMPLIFFAGGAAVAISLDGRRRRHGAGRHTSTSWLAERFTRLARPVLPLALVWVPLPHMLQLAGVPAQPVQLASELVGRLLWFLAAYVVLVGLTPLLLRAADRFRGAEIAALAGGAIAVDIVRFTFLDGATAPGYANVVLVWGAIYQAGIHYGRGSAWSPRRAVAVSATGLLALIVAVAVGPYPASTIGMPGDAASNMNPPAAVLLALAAAQLGLLVSLRSRLTRWARRRPVTAALGWVSSRMMTIYLWHTSALVAVVGVVVIGRGVETPEPFSTAWRDAVPLWLAALTATLAVLVRAAERFEHAVPVPGRRPGRARLAGAGVLIAAALLILAAAGFSPATPGWPVLAAVALAIGVGLASGHNHPLAGREHAVQKARLVV